ncbi:hypothetical protein ACIBJF_46475 [Streptomyces sp. NPDC050743]|uniref:hypothetical protein n=1 Tax=Streptomyces sp. NPDC050743 TaxID=3365634 RepID=UPI0037B973E3
MRELGFAVAECRLFSCFVLRDRDGRTVDVHPVVSYFGLELLPEQTQGLPT